MRHPYTVSLFIVVSSFMLGHECMAEEVGDLDVTISVIDSRKQDINEFINRIALPKAAEDIQSANGQAAETGEKSSKDRRRTDSTARERNTRHRDYDRDNHRRERQTERDNSGRHVESPSETQLRDTLESNTKDTTTIQEDAGANSRDQIEIDQPDAQEVQEPVKVETEKD